MMSHTEINQTIARIEGLTVKGINEAGQVFVQYGKFGRLYNPVKVWGQGGPLLEKYRVYSIPVTSARWEAVARPDESIDVEDVVEVGGYSLLEAGMKAIIAHNNGYKGLVSRSLDEDE